MSRHFIRWLQTIHSITATLAHAVMQDHSVAAFDDIAEQLEALAKNIRERSRTQNVVERF